MQLLNPPTRPLARTAVCGASIAVGDCVRIQGTAPSGKLDVSLYTPDGLPGVPYPAVGVVATKTSDTTCRVVLWGVVTDVYTGMTPGVYQFVSAYGRCTETQPAAFGAASAWITPIGVALTSRDLLVNPGPPAQEAVTKAYVDSVASVTAPTYLHTQSSPSASWTVAHNLGFRPTVAVYTTGGVEVICDIVHLSPDVLVVGAAAPFSGSARLN